MLQNFTFSMIKPDAYAKGYTGSILTDIEQAGFKILAMRLTRLSRLEAEAFYEVHRDKSFYEELCKYMSSGPMIALILGKENAVEDYRKLIGATDPKQAAPNTLRAKYASSIEANAVHGADSQSNARIEAYFFFSTRDITC